MDPITTLIIAGVATLIASSAKSIVSRLFARYAKARPQTEITITTNSGKRVTIGSATNLTDHAIQEIVATVERQSNTSSADQ